MTIKTIPADMVGEATLYPFGVDGWINLPLGAVVRDPYTECPATPGAYIVRAEARINPGCGDSQCCDPAWVSARALTQAEALGLGLPGCPGCPGCCD